MNLRALALSLTCTAYCASALPSSEQQVDMALNELDALFNTRVISASDREESIKQAPAKIMVITSESLARAGYRNLSEVFDNLPGMTVNRAFSDNYFNLIWRGIRHNIGSSHILMLDGMELNHLYFSETEVIATLPINQIKQIEIVYGPASAVYGKNAFVGAINIITRHDDPFNRHRGSLRAGDDRAGIYDGFFSHQTDRARFSLGIRAENRYLDTEHFSGYEYTNPDYLNDPLLWGDFLSLPQYGTAKSPTKNRALDARASTGTHQFGFQLFELASGYGSKYAFDKVQPNDLWIEQDLAAFWKMEQQFRERLSGKTLVRWRKSGVNNDSAFLEGYNVLDSATGLNQRLLDFSLWETNNYELHLKQSVNWSVNEYWQFNGGFHFDKLRLQKAYNINYGPSLAVSDIDVDTYPFPQPPGSDNIVNNRIEIEERGFFALARYQLASTTTGSNYFNHWVHLGYRLDDQSEYGSNDVIRVGYVANWSNYTLKLLYGESYEEPPPRLLYGGWQGAGSDPDLKPQQGDNIEINFEAVFESFSWSMTLYSLNYSDLFLTVPGDAINSGKGKVKGADLSFLKQWNFESIKRIKWLSFWSYVDSKTQMTAIDQWEPVGDIVQRSLINRFDIDFNDNWMAQLNIRTIDDRTAVATNPIEKFNGFTMTDINLRYLPFDVNWSLSFSVFNAFNHSILHPGLRQADAGTEPGTFNGNGEWVGSNGFFNSALPQPGRNFLIGAHWSY